MRLAGRDLTPADYEALLSLDEDSEGGGLAPETLARLPRYSFAAGAAAVCCAVCLDDALEGVELLRLPCGHSFHVPCISNWLAITPFCPVCKARVPERTT
jgi:hypothetical protein